MAEVGDLRVKLSLDNAQFEKSITSMNRTLQAVGQEIRGLQNKGKDWGASLDGLKQKQDAYSRLLEGQQTKVRKLAAEYEKAKQETGEHSAQTEKLAVQLNKAAAEMNRTERELGEITSELQKQEAEMKRAQSNWTKLGESASAFGDKMKDIGRSMADVGKELSLKITAPLTALGVAFTKTAMDFEAQMDRVGAIAGATAEEMEKLKATAMDLGASTSKSASEVAIGMENMAAMGFTVNEIMAAMPGIISASEASGADMAQTADVVAASLNMFGLEAKEASRVADILAQSANQSSADITDLQYALKYAGPPANALGLSLEETAAAIGLMTDAGMQGEQAGTTLRSALLSLLQPTEKNSKLMDTLGIAVTDANGEMLGISDIVKNLSASLDGMTEANKAATLASIFGKEAVSGMLTLIAAGPEQIDAMTASLENSSGASKEAADKMKDNLKGALEELGGAFETLSIQLGNLLIPMIREVATVIQSLVERFSALSPSMQMTSLVIAGIAAAIGPVLVVVGLLVSSIGSIASAFGAASLAIANAGGMMAVLGSAFTALTGPVGIAVLAIGGIVTAMVVAYNKVEWFRDGVQNVFGAVKNVISNVMNAVSSLISDVWTKIKTFWETNGNQIKQATENVFNVIKTVVSTVMPAIKTVIDVAMTAIKFIVEGIWNAINGVIEGVLNVILGLVKTFASLFTGDWKGLWEGIKQVLAGVVEAVWNLMQLLFYGRILKGLATFATSFTGTFTTLWASIKSLFTKSIDLIKNAFTTGFNAMKNTATTLMGSISSVISSIWNVIRTVFTSTINAIKNVFSNGFNQFLTIVKNTMNTIVSTIRGTVSSMIQVGKDLISGLIKGIKNMTVGAIEAVTGVVDGVIGKAKSLLKINSPSKVFEEIGEWTGEGLAKGVTSTKKMNEKAMKDITDVITKITNQNASEVSAIAKKAEEERTKVQNDYQKKRSNMKKQDAKKIHELETDMQEKLKKINDKAWADMQKKEAEVAAARIDAINSFVENKKKANELSLIDEAEYWRTSYTQFDTGSKENVALRQSYQDNVKRINDAINTVNTSHLAQAQKINDDLIKGEQDLNQKYNDTLNSRYQTILGYYGLFDAVTQSEAVDKSELTSNLQDQVSSLKDWSGQIEQLKKRKVSSGLITELQGMGVKAIEQLKALNSMTDIELNNYQKLYQAKMKIAKEQAIKELEPMKQETQTKIQQLRDAANIELTKLNTEWQNAIKKVVGGTEQQLKTLHQVGKNAGQGLLNGLSSMEGSLINKAQEMASSISKTIQSALKIKSPSRVMMGFGENIGEGLIIGMDDMIKKVAQSSSRLSGAVVNAQASLSNSAQKSMQYGSSNVTNSTSVTNSMPINVVLNYSGAGNSHDAMQMVDFIESELGSRLNSRLRMSGVKT